MRNEIETLDNEKLKAWLRMKYSQASITILMSLAMEMSL